MGFDNTVTVVGNVTRDPELRFAQSGMPIAQFGLAWNRRRQDQEDDTSFFDVVCFRQLAENVSESIRKGARVVVYGTLQQRTWENDSGDRRSKVEILADDVAPSLKWATAEVRRTERSGGEGTRGGYSRGDGGGYRSGGDGGGYRSGGDGGGDRSGGDQVPSRQSSSVMAEEEPF